MASLSLSVTFSHYLSLNFLLPPSFLDLFQISTKKAMQKKIILSVGIEHLKIR
jgi:hypothetical protein